MKPKRFTEEQIIGILKQAQAGMKIVDLCRMHGIPKRNITQPGADEHVEVFETLDQSEILIIKSVLRNFSGVGPS